MTNSNYKIIEYKSEYKPDIIRALMELQAHEHNLSNTRKPASIELCEEYFLRVLENATIFLLLIDETFTGFISYYIEQDNTIFETEDSNKYAYISDICVLKKFQNNGIAGNLLNKVYEDLKANKFKGRIRIHTLANNIAAIKTYEIIYDKEMR